MPHRTAAILALVLALTGGVTEAAETKAKKTRATAEDVKAALAKPGKAVAAKSAVLAAEPEVKTLRRIVEGQVVHVGKRSMSVEFAATEDGSYEMLLPFGAHVTVEGIKAVGDLKYGDRVKVGIEQAYRDDPKGERTILKTEALAVVLVQRAGNVPAAGATVVQ